MADFATDVSAWCDKAGALADIAFRGIGEAALERVKELTPVRTGWLRSNWQAVRRGEVAPRVQSSGADIAINSMAALGSRSGAVVGTTPGVVGNRAGAAGQPAGTVAGTTGTAAPTIGAPAPLTGSAAGALVSEVLREVRDGAEPQAGGGVPADLKAGEVLVILNPVSYARAIEYGREIQRKDGQTTRTHGRGMVQQTVSELPQIAQRVVASLTRRRL